MIIFSQQILHVEQFLWVNSQINSLRYGLVKPLICADGPGTLVWEREFCVEVETTEGRSGLDLGIWYKMLKALQSKTNPRAHQHCCRYTVVIY